MLKGWIEEWGSKYYFDLSNGDMVKGSRTIDGKVYYFGSDGILKKDGDKKPEVSYQAVGQVNKKATSVHVRKGPSTANDVITSVTTGELLMIIGKTQPESDGLFWYKIELNGQELYIRNDFVDIVSEIAINKYATIASGSTIGAHIRSLPVVTATNLVTTLNNGDAIDIIGEYHPIGAKKPWYKIKYHKASLSLTEPHKYDSENMKGIGFIRSDLIDFNYEGTPVSDGWFKDKEQNWNYFVDGKALTGVWTIDDLFRAFDSNGKLLINKQEVHTEAGLAFIDEDGVAIFVDQNKLIQEFAVSPLEGYKNTEIFGEGRLMHIFRGNVKKILSSEKWLVSGNHSLWAKFDPLLIPEKKAFINDSKAFESNVKGEFINYGEIKVIKTELHAWFPEEWNPQKLINILKAGLEQGIQGEYSGDDKIPNAYEILVEYENVIIRIVQSKNTKK
ncbi:SH3 domain-containing protein [uncultured Clostridium sp.]|jgi:uncharacterized protein YgiM (DUF1202 family)|uniref:SH3 domain-containing protein n=1 Tax=uncultured Clostridium sp. TaxID=59620 RepID=UPI0026383920|nr:SH3 domain-containing protein [uncultured Clostridium sp.]